MNVITRTAAGAALVTLITAGQSASAQAAPVQPVSQLHNVTYIARVDAWAAGSVVTFMRTDTETASADLDAFGGTFEANTVLADPSRAGMVIRLRFPTTANVHCEIRVDDVVTVKSDRFVNTWGNTNDPHTGAMLCGALISGMA